jgi:hypothetical protein
MEIFSIKRFSTFVPHSYVVQEVGTIDKSTKPDNPCPSDAAAFTAVSAAAATAAAPFFYSRPTSMAAIR